jgi:hypothetical protein
MTRGTRPDGTRPQALVVGATGGNKRAKTHGAGSELRSNARPAKAVLELAGRIADAYLGGVVPAQLTRPEFMASVESWARREARARILSEYLDGLTVEEMISPTRAGAVKSVFEIWLSAEHSAAKARHDLGLDPSSWAGIQKDLGIAGRAADDRLAQLGEQGAAIRARHQGTVVPLRPEPEEDGRGAG